MDMTIDLSHLVDVFCDDSERLPRMDGDSRYHFWAECSCGWTSDRYDEYLLAENAGADHREAAVGPADGFDRLMSDLLDLQDDIARAVVWLAEHWTADLPVPGWLANGVDYDHERPAFLVRAYCSNDADVVRAAELLGVDVVKDPAADRYGSRYRRAARRFGRVEVEAFASLATTCTECGTEFSGAHCPGCYDPPDATRTLITASDLATPEAGAA